MSLSQEILEGTYQGVERLLAQGAPINVLDEYGFTPLIHATVTNRLDLVKLLLKHDARVDLIDSSGNDAILWAVDNNNLEMCQLLLQAGADANAYNSGGQPALFYPILRNNKDLIKVFINKGAKLDFAKDFILTKLIGHRFELRGNSDVINAEGLFISVDLEGFYLEFTLGLIRESLERFINSFVAHRMDIHSDELKVIINSFNNASKLREFKHFNANIEANKQTIYQLMEIDLLLLPVSYQGHAITFVKHGNFLAKCDRGVNTMTAPTVINTIGNPKPLGHHFYTNLLYQKHTQKFIKSDLIQILDLKPYATLPIKHQITGNCSWANVEASVPTMLYMLLYDKIQDKNKIESLVSQIMDFYHTWLEWDKDRALEDCLLDFDKLSFVRQKARATLLGVVLFQACNPNKPADVARAQKILNILIQKEFQYIVRIYTNIYVKGHKTSEGRAYQQLIEMCGYQLSQFSN